MQTLTASVYLPLKIERVDDWASPSSGITRSSIAVNHTLYPYWAITYQPELCAETDRVINGGAPSVALERASVLKTRRSWSKYLKYCPLCAIEDISTYGETYWRRQHQLSEIFYCTKHEIRLHDSDVSLKSATTGFFPATNAATVEFIADIVDDLAPYKMRLLKIGQESEWLIKNGLKVDWAANGYDKYWRLLRDKGLASLQGRCDYQALETAFYDYWDKDFVNRLINEIADSRFNGWAYQVDRNKMRAYKPLYHILLMCFLSGSVSKFIESDPAKTPYGHPPFVCENKVCLHYHVDGAEMLSLRYYCGGVTATFECAHCGMRYKYNKPKNLRYHISIADYGHVWDSELRRCCQDSNITNEQAAIILGCTINALVLQKKKRGLIEAAFYDKEMGPEKYYKLKVSELCEQYDEVTRSMLEKYVPGAYSYLVRFHKEWLRSHMVYQRERKHRREYEEQLLDKIRKIIDKFETEGYPNRQMTYSYIAGLIGTTRDSLRRRNAPRDLLENVVESREDWIRRRVTVAYHQRSTSNTPLLFSDAKCELSICDATYTKYRKLIEQVIEELNKDA